MARKKSAKPITKPSKPRQEELDEVERDPIPSLRVATLLYLVVLLLTWGLLGVLDLSIQAEFLRLLIAPILAIGATAMFILVNNYDLGRLLGNRPKITTWLAAFLIGMLLYLPIAWLILGSNVIANALLGVLPQRATLATLANQILVRRVGPIVPFILPICQGILFWAFFQRAAEGMGKLRAAFLTALCFALFATVSAHPYLGLVGFVAYLPLGLAAAFVGYYSGSALTALAVTLGHAFVIAVFQESEAQRQLFVALGAEAPIDLINLRWLMAVAVLGFIAFVVVQVIRIALRQDDPSPRTPPRALWWAPLLAALALYVFVGLEEVYTRIYYRQLTTNSATPTATPTGSGQTIPPIPQLPPTATPRR